MILTVQVKSFIVSFLFGCFYALMFNLNYKFLFCNKKTNKILINLFFNIDIFLLYFLLLLKINYGVIHIYFLIVLAIGFYIGNYYTKKFRNLL